MNNLKEGQDYVLNGTWYVQAHQTAEGWQLLDFNERRVFTVVASGEIMDAGSESPEPTGATIENLQERSR